MRPPIGILGGMGPQASVEAYSRIIKESKLSGAVANSDFPHLLISNLPVPSLVNSRADEKRACLMVGAEAARLAQAGCSSVVLACNTMHLHEDFFQTCCRGKFMSLPRHVAKHAQEKGFKKVGILGTPSTIRSGLYEQHLQARNIDVLRPPEAKIGGLGEIISAIIAGKIPLLFQPTLSTYIDALAEQGAEAVLLGCTELPLIAGGKHSEPYTVAAVPVLDSLDLLSELVCSLYYADRNLLNMDLEASLNDYLQVLAERDTKNTTKTERPKPVKLA